MSPPEELPAFPFDEAHPSALAIYCSDGRFTRAIEQLFLGLGHPRLDTLTMPGGPGLLDADSARLAESSAVRRAVSFLIQGHAIQTAILVAHEGCGHYRARFGGTSQTRLGGTSQTRLGEGRSPEDLLELQRRHLGAAAAWLAEVHPGVKVSLYIARIRAGQIVFVPA